jgi:hypothetical protein
MSIFTLAVGLAVVPAIALSPLYAGRLRLVRSARLGTAFVLAAVGLALIGAAAPGAAPRNQLFVCAFVLMLIGALLIGKEEPEDPPGPSSDDPPWWPEFEAELRSYTRRHRQPIPGR